MTKKELMNILENVKDNDKIEILLDRYEDEWGVYYTLYLNGQKIPITKISNFSVGW